MALREYTDASGVAWQVWHVVPTTRTAEPSVPNERRKRPDPSYPGDRRRRAFTLTPGMEGGWLCFECSAEKRRLAPVPGDWENCDEAALAGYLGSAEPVSRRIIDEAPPQQLDSKERETRAEAH
ncbi:MAG: hypothetical protein KY464_08395 [Gemmatimonadetes bacterium]|nr:hypothetical protein [Gemmatimonadota bacterium]